MESVDDPMNVAAWVVLGLVAIVVELLVRVVNVDVGWDAWVVLELVAIFVDLLVGVVNGDVGWDIGVVADMLVDDNISAVLLSLFSILTAVVDEVPNWRYVYNRQI